MATVIRSSAGEALQQSSSNLLNLILEATRIQENRRQFDTNLAEQTRQWEEQMAFAQAGRTHGLLQQIILNAPPGSTIGSLGISDEALQQSGLAGIFDPNAVLTPETVESLVNTAGVNAIREGGLPGDITERMISRIATGEATTETMRALQNLTAETNYDILSEKFLSLDERDKQQIFESLVGLPPSVEFQFGGQRFAFESGQAASTALGFMNLNLAERSLSQQGRDAMLPYREALKTRMEETATAMGIGNARARSEIESILAGEYDNPAAINGIADPQVRAFVSSQLATRDLADNTLMGQFRRTTQGQAYFNMLEAGQTLESFLPKEQVAEVLESITSAMNEQGLPIARLDRRGFGRSDRVVLPGTLPADQTVQIPQDLVGNAVAEEAIRGGASPEFVRSWLTANGGSTPASTAPAATPRNAPLPAAPAPARATTADSSAVEKRVAALRSQIASMQAEVDAIPADAIMGQRARGEVLKRRIKTMQDQLTQLQRRAAR